MRKSLLTAIAAVLVLCLHLPAFAQETVSGEVINVNYRDQTAYVDVGSDILAVGDVMEVQDGGAKIYLQVVETTDAVSRLTPSQEPGFEYDPSNFDSIMIGATAVRVTAAKKPPKPTPAVFAKQRSGPAPTVDAVVSSITDQIDTQTIVPTAGSSDSTPQALEARLDKMVESNVKLFNSLTELLNEKRQWEAGAGKAQKDLLEAQGKIKELTSRIEEISMQGANAVAEKEKFRQKNDELQARVVALKDKLVTLTKIIDDRLKHE